MRHLLLFSAIMTLAACERAEVNPPTEPAAPLRDEDRIAPKATGSSDTRPPGTGPASFVGRWAADVSWCAAPQGERRPIEITPVRFEGYENSCHIASISETANGHQAALQCQSEGAARNERVQMTVVGDILALTWLDRGDTTVKLHKCTTLGEVAQVAPPPT
ncbi:hypothetical protein [Brevundimonas sp.]|uniref:hypothetical protein n=1 Tax=Brevundimonas sp. TaxID=1871086 RepID=UPI001A29BFAA|nr:hypothetical protein [Brevundimonas sp.]MBJ7485292.1 hypothetical protein [Brevundimonas sp.]